MGNASFLDSTHAYLSENSVNLPAFLSFAVSVSRNDLPPMKSRALPEGPWEGVPVDYKGPIGRMSEFYYHVVIYLYSQH